MGQNRQFARDSDDSAASALAIHREKYQIVRDFAPQCAASEFNPTAQKRRKKVEMLFAQLNAFLTWAVSD